MDVTVQTDAAMMDDLVAGLPQAPLAMPKQVLERAGDGFLAGLMARLAPRATRTGG